MVFTNGSGSLCNKTNTKIQETEKRTLKPNPKRTEGRQAGSLVFTNGSGSLCNKTNTEKQETEKRTLRTEGRQAESLDITGRSSLFSKENNTEKQGTKKKVHQSNKKRTEGSQAGSSGITGGSGLISKENNKEKQKTTKITPKPNPNRTEERQAKSFHLTDGSFSNTNNNNVGVPSTKAIVFHIMDLTTGVLANPKTVFIPIEAEYDTPLIDVLEMVVPVPRLVEHKIQDDYDGDADDSAIINSNIVEKIELVLPKKEEEEIPIIPINPNRHTKILTVRDLFQFDGVGNSCLTINITLKSCAKKQKTKERAPRTKQNDERQAELSGLIGGSGSLSYESNSNAEKQETKKRALITLKSCAKKQETKERAPRTKQNDKRHAEERQAELSGLIGGSDSSSNESNSNAEKQETKKRALITLKSCAKKQETKERAPRTKQNDERQAEERQAESSGLIGGSGSLSNESHSNTEKQETKKRALMPKQNDQRQAESSDLIGGSGSFSNKNKNRKQETTKRKRKRNTNRGLPIAPRQRSRRVHQNEDRWANMYDKLVAYATDKSLHHIDEEFSSWVEKQRIEYIAGDLRPSRVSRLNDINFQWEYSNLRTDVIKKEHNNNNSGADERWMAMYRKFVNYTIRNKIASGPLNMSLSMNGWCTHQRELYRNGNLSQDRISLMNSFGFLWLGAP